MIWLPACGYEHGLSLSVASHETHDLLAGQAVGQPTTTWEMTDTLQGPVSKPVGHPALSVAVVVAFVLASLVAPKFRSPLAARISARLERAGGGNDEDGGDTCWEVAEWNGRGAAPASAGKWIKKQIHNIGATA
jgi:hypothetical protein